MNLTEVDINNLPKHIGIIMDGNGRWAKTVGKPRIFGHRAGVEALREIVRTSSNLGIKILTVYAFSTENWNRPKIEVEGLMKLLVEYFNKEIDELNDNNVKIRILGNIEELGNKTKQIINNAYNLTKNNTGLTFNIALNYGGRNEIIRGVKKLYDDIINNQFKIDQLNEENFSNYLFTKDLEEPDLIIRTSGEQRLSNFLIWQSAYSELYFTDVYWPDFTKELLIDAIVDYQNRKRRFGGV